MAYISLLFFSCSVDKEIDLLDTSLRIENATSTHVRFVKSNGFEFGDIPAGVITGYEEFEEIFSWPDVRVEFKDQTYKWRPPTDNISLQNLVQKQGSYRIRINALNDKGYDIDAELIAE